jgi:hypothetical protein
MDALYIVTTYVVLDDLLKAMGFQDDGRAHVTTAEVLTVAVVAARYFQNHQERALCVLQQLGAIPRLSTSRFNRRLHQAQAVLDDGLQWLSQLVARPWLAIVDTLPLPVCHRVRLERCKKVQGKAYLGWVPAKKQWFYGWRLHWVCDPDGIPLAFDLLPATCHELTAVHHLLADLPERTCVVGDGAYLGKVDQQLAWDAGRLYLIAPHQRTMRPNLPEERGLLHLYRSTIETVHSQLEAMGLQRLRARTHLGFVLKVLASLFALIVNRLL